MNFPPDVIGRIPFALGHQFLVIAAILFLDIGLLEQETLILVSALIASAMAVSWL